MKQYAGKTTILECQITAYPHNENKWRFNGRDLLRRGKYSTELYNDETNNKVTLMLKIESLSSEDFGKYECVSENELGSDSQFMHLLGKIKDSINILDIYLVRSKTV